MKVPSRALQLAALVVQLVKNAHAFTNPTSPYKSIQLSAHPDSEILSPESETSSTQDEEGSFTQLPRKRYTYYTYQKPQWMKCINAVVPPNIRILNEAVSILANVSREEATKLIEIGAVWAKMETLTDEAILDQYYDNGNSAAIQYADLPSGWGAGDYGLEGNNDSDDEDMSLDEYVERQENLRYKRILSPVTIDPGTDIRIYPHPRRFPTCYEFEDENRLLYEDTTFIVVDKPPMLPVQPEPSNYEECCPGCVNLLMGPFQTIGGEDVKRPLICHRVDSCVGGCLVLSKDGNGQRVFSQLQVSFLDGCFVSS
jgi:23S rRNA-/tRNA-specific pseudouridylate synthase